MELLETVIVANKLSICDVDNEYKCITVKLHFENVQIGFFFKIYRI